MSNRDMTLQVIVKLRDEMSRGLDGALRKITSWGNRAKAVFSSVGAGIGALSQKIGAFGVGAGLGLAKGLDSLIVFDSNLRDSAIILKKHGAEAEQWIKRSATAWQDASKLVGQTSLDLAVSQHELLGAGFDEDPATRMVNQIGRAATASGAAMKDMTATAKVLFQNWKIEAGQMELALAKLFEAGNLGNFELRDMAQFLPELAPNTAVMGLDGFRAISSVGAMLQVSKMGAGTPGEAATNFRDFINQLTSAHFKKRMEDQGVDVDAVLKDAAKKNINPIEAVIGKILKITGAGSEAQKAAAEAAKKGLTPGDTQKLVEERVTQAIAASKLGEVLINQYGKTFMATFMSHLDDYKKIRGGIDAAGLEGLGQGFDTRMAGLEAKQRMATERVEQIGRRGGDSISGIFDKISAGAEAVQGWIKALDEVSPKIVDLGVQTGGLASIIGGITFTLRMLGFGGGAAAAGGAVAGGAAAAAAGGAGTAGAAGSGLLSLVGRYGAKGLGLLTRGGTGILGALAFVSEALQAGIPTTKEGMQYRLDAGPIDFATYERAWREEKEYRRDPEAARGRAMMRKGGITLPDPIRRDPEHEPWLKIGKPDLSFEAITGNKKPDLQYMIGAAFAGFLKATGMAKAADKPAQPPPPQKVDVQANVTVKVEGPGTVVSTSTKTTGGATAADRGPTVGRP